MDTIRFFKQAARTELKRRQAEGETDAQLQRTQHVVARRNGFHNWSELVHASESQLELAVLMECWPNLTNVGMDGIRGTAFDDRSVRAMPADERHAKYLSLRAGLLEKYERIFAMREWLHENMTPIQSINDRRSSYELKGIYERIAGEYITNGDFIAAALLADFRVDIAPDDFERNVSFNMSERDASRLWKVSHHRAA